MSDASNSMKNCSLVDIAGKALPSYGSINMNCEPLLQDQAVEFIKIMHTHAKSKCQLEGRNEVNGDDIIWAFNSFGMERYANALQIYVEKYRENEETDSAKL